MVPETTEAARVKQLTLNEIASLYDIRLSTARSKLKRHLAEEPDKEKVFQAGRGQRAALFDYDFVQKVFGDIGVRPHSQVLTDLLKRPKLRTIKEIGSDEHGCIDAVLQSRMAGDQAYNTLVREMAKTGKGLRIQCITGTDFFNAHKPIEGDFRARAAKPELGRARILLLYPFEKGGDGARIRSLSEGDKDLKTSQFYRDARATVDYLAVNAKNLRFDVKWMNELPPGLMIWTEEYAMLEPYDYGRDDDAGGRCIGRRAPLLIVRGGTPYHSKLKNSFDFVFDGTAGTTHIKTYEIEEIRAGF